MGGKSKKEVVVGHKYFLGTHMGLVHGPVDSLNRIRVADKVVWVGSTSGGSININQEELFGGEGAEGGISGTFTFANGETTQLPSTYLKGQLGNVLPAFRGVSCAILEQMYVTANNPYLKPWAFMMTRTDVTTRGEEQWYVEKARIGGVEETTSGVGLFTVVSQTNTSSFTATVGGKEHNFFQVNGSADIRFNQDAVVDVLMIGAGGGGSAGSDRQSGGGCGQVRIMRCSFASGEEIGISGAAGGTGGSAGGSATVGALIAVGGAGAVFCTPAGGCPLTGRDGDGGSEVWGGSGAAGSTGTTADDPHPVSTAVGGVGLSGLRGGNVGNDWTSSDQNPCNSRILRGGSGGGAGFCGNGEDGQDSPKLLDNTKNISGSGGRGGPGVNIGFTGTTFHACYGGRGSSGNPRGFCQAGPLVESWFDTYGKVYGSGGDGNNSLPAAHGGAGLVVLRWLA